jgi:hypothetical protein
LFVHPSCRISDRFRFVFLLFSLQIYRIAQPTNRRVSDPLPTGPRAEVWLANKFSGNP